MHSPNILLITSDQQHYNTLGIRNPEIHTPNLDRLAREGTLFNRAYCSNPTCTPSRASIITGLRHSTEPGRLGQSCRNRFPRWGTIFRKPDTGRLSLGKPTFSPKPPQPPFLHWKLNRFYMTLPSGKGFTDPSMDSNMWS